jgi:hypothetical protein
MALGGDLVDLFIGNWRQFNATVFHDMLVKHIAQTKIGRFWE